MNTMTLFVHVLNLTIFAKNVISNVLKYNNNKIIMTTTLFYIAKTSKD